MHGSKNNNKSPLVSVIIPTHNRPELLQRAIRSVEDQTYSNIEIIVVDDASEIEIEISFVPSLKVLRNEENKGGGFSRNRGLNEAKGFFINFLDDDDILYPDKIARQVQCFQNSTDADLGMVAAHSRDHRSGKEYIHFNRCQGNIYKKLLYKFMVYGIETILYKKEALIRVNGFDVELESSQEYDLLIRAAEHYTFDYVDDILSQEFRSYGQISTNFDKKIKGTKKLFQKNQERFRKLGLTFILKMKLKYMILMIRFYIGKWFGEKAYRMLIPRS